ncbi:MAG: LamB/YcsF family protein, partial [Clostridia bacterium]|nr:LamB/YcsF family protein [Clostridia bacterium]
MISIDLNADLGESFGRYTLGMDEKIMEVISSANIACGFHAGDPMVMERTVRLAAEAGIAIGAHPGFPDLMGFGRRNMAVSPEEARAYILYQLGALDAFLRPMGIRMRHVKPHGALYNMAAADEQLARAICGAVKDFDPELRLVGLSGSLLIRAAEKTGLRAISEVFADRAYEADGSLVSRRKPGAIISDEREALRRVIRMVKEG